MTSVGVSGKNRSSRRLLPWSSRLHLLEVQLGDLFTGATFFDDCTVFISRQLLKRSTLYGGDDHGYTDYPTLVAQER